MAIEGSSLRDVQWKTSYRPVDGLLENFYVPALSRAVRYDRIAGFFSSTALSVAAAGVARLVARGGKMRLLVGAQLSKQDVDAILRGACLDSRIQQRFQAIINDPEALSDALVKERIKVLAWLVSQGQLEIRVVVEADSTNGDPLVSDGYFHVKSGIMWDEHGDSLAFTGSINESLTAWKNNFERFKVFLSWDRPEDVKEEQEFFDRLWADAEPGWATVNLPDAVKRDLIKYAPNEPPTVEPGLGPVVEESIKSRWIAQFLRDAPYLVQDGWKVGVETAGVDPFPHQRSVAYDVLSQFPCKKLLADEVGLGKTIEVGLILRSLLLSGRINNCLLLVPRSLVKQWQEELRDKFLVDAPFYDGSKFVYFEGNTTRSEPLPSGRDPWRVHPVTLASAQMAKMAGRSESLLNSGEWDLVILDEAHHARRRDFATLNRYRPNRLLRLMQGLTERTKALLLMTATPMQVHPIEVYDLLKLLGLPEKWQDQTSFMEYINSLRETDDTTWGTVFSLLDSSIKHWGVDKSWEESCGRALGPVGRQRILNAIDFENTSAVYSFSDSEREWLRQLMRRQQPVPWMTYRSTRPLLRQYFAQGLLKQNIPYREPAPLQLDMTPQEQELYHAVEQYISDYYQRYEELKNGLGFVMTIYRRRLTSSLHALKCSLERRREFLQNKWNDATRPMGLDDEDLEDADLDDDITETLVKKPPEFWQNEVIEVDALLEQLEGMTHEGKYLKVMDDLGDVLKQVAQVIVFTQYTDTLDFLREQLLAVFQTKLACYSGRGGEVWDGTNWSGMSKERLQAKFAAGDISVLLCTDAAAEGLNLQNCGVIFNYDMPWNPMKVEQRIGRIDRIGQKRPVVKIRHYLYKDTVEARIYEVLGDRIDWFKSIVGELQPILHHAQQAIRKAAMVVGQQREDAIKEGIQQLEGAAQAAKEYSPTLKFEPNSPPPTAGGPVDLFSIQEILVPRQPWQESLEEAPEQHCYKYLRDKGSLITFDRETATGATGASICTYGSSSLEEMLSLREPPQRKDIVRFEDNAGTPVVGYYRWDSEGWKKIDSLPMLVNVLETEETSEEVDAGEVKSLFENDVVSGRT